MKKRIAIACALVCLCLAGAGTWGAIRMRTELRKPFDATPYLQMASSPELLDRNERLLFAYLNPDEQWVFRRDLKDIAPVLLQATIAVEDQRFYDHRGVDGLAIIRAVWQNVTNLGVRSGASTITMQLVKMHVPHDGSLSGKIGQAMDALRLDRQAIKADILEAYLNKAPYGMNLVGCEAAARRYFGKSALELTLAEAALLAGIPKSPNGYMPIDHPERAKARRDYVLGRMLAEGFISEAQCAAAQAAPVGARFHAYPQRAPHLAMAWSPSMKPGDRRRTTIDADIQSTAERLAREAVKRYDKSITNAAIMVVDTQTAEVLARVGSVDFFYTPGGGQVDSTRAVRSPGSALKPFTYGLALDQNLLYASEMLLDGSLDYGLYSPKNYDGEYRGLTSASYALRRSLNVPAVQVLDRVGVDSLYGFYKSLGISTLTKSAEYYGLGLTIGNCEVRMDEVLAAYCAIANMGVYRPLRQHADTHAAPGREVFSPDIALKLYEMLEQPFPGEFQRDVAKARGVLTPVAWKTGTSTGLHDAWTFAFNRQYVVAVWMGNNDGRPSPQLVGAHAALPLAREVFRSLPRRSTPAWPTPAGLAANVTVCAATGLPASDWCPATRSESFPKSQFLHRRCDVHYPGTDGQTVERWPGSPKGWDLAKVSAPKPDTAVAAVETSDRVEGLRIRQPADKAEYVLTREAKADTIRLRTSLDGKQTVHWYLNNTYLGDSQPGSPLLLSLASGTHTLTAMTADGEIDTVKYLVEEPYTPANFDQ